MINTNANKIPFLPDFNYNISNLKYINKIKVDIFDIYLFIDKETTVDNYLNRRIRTIGFYNRFSETAEWIVNLNYKTEYYSFELKILANAVSRYFGIKPRYEGY